MQCIIQCKLRISIRSVEAISMLIDSYSYAEIKYYYIITVSYSRGNALKIHYYIVISHIYISYTV